MTRRATRCNNLAERLTLQRLPEPREALRRDAPAGSTIPSFTDALFGPHRAWVRDAACAEPPNDRLTWVIEKSGGIENASTVVQLFEVCSTCPVRRECLLDAAGETAFSVEGCWGGTVATERREAAKRIGKQMTTAEPVLLPRTWNGTQATSDLGAGVKWSVDQRLLAQAVTDELMETFDERLQRWRAQPKPPPPKPTQTTSRGWC